MINSRFCFFFQRATEITEMVWLLKLRQGGKYCNLINLIITVKHRIKGLKFRSKFSLKIIKNLNVHTRARVNSFAREITAISAIVAHVAFTELGFYALAVARAVVQYCTCRLTAVRTSKTGKATEKDISGWTYFHC